MSTGDWLTALGFTLWIPFMILIATNYKKKLHINLLGVAAFTLLTAGYVMTHDEFMAVLTAAIDALNCYEVVRLAREGSKRNERQ